MKGAILLLLVACLLIATPLTAAAYEPTNGAALGSMTVEIKTTLKEEVASIRAGEIVTASVVPIPVDASYFLIFASMGFYGLALYVARHDNTDIGRADRGIASRFG